jgi:hypothetical protein
MAQQRYLHNKKILDRQPAKLKAIYPGTILEFHYSGKNISDRKPLVLVLWNDRAGNKVHGINLNYLNEMRIKELMERIVQKGGTKIVLEDQMKPDDYDDNLPYRNLVNDPYTRIKLPTYREKKGGNPLSKQEAMVQMDRLYNKVLKKAVKKHDIYRSYLIGKIKAAKVVTYDMRGLFR